MPPRFSGNGQRPFGGLKDILELGRSLDAFLQSAGGKLTRYETALQRQLAASMAELRQMQERRAQGSPDVCIAPGEATPRGQCYGSLAEIEAGEGDVRSTSDCGSFPHKSRTSPKLSRVDMSQMTLRNKPNHHRNRRVGLGGKIEDGGRVKGKLGV